ncbi:putative methyltransferase [Corallococcus coralloides]|uniref:Putative methyltransferase n=1 Tax=Corallococcus coralloides TaxID=184914 RepID=A0A410RKN1_CORCK|nr:class I SAM-dependent methyltransferase [Corallococcus coralloides]QAT82445.1 putative methyltransferase [Corallococcus coralloides]
MTDPAPPPEPPPRRDDTLGDFDLPFFQRLSLQLQGIVIAFVLRGTDLLLLLFRPRLLKPYMGLWWQRILWTPYRWRRTFEMTRALQTTGQSFRELMYGETPLVTALWFLKRAGVGRSSRVVDLGAGRGRVLLAARWWGARAHGVELIADHVTRVAPWLGPAGVTFTVGDMTREPLGDATHIFCNWVAFSPETKARLVAHLRTCAPGTRIITVTRPIQAEGFSGHVCHWMLFTWGLEKVWLQQYLPGPIASP